MVLVPDAHNSSVHFSPPPFGSDDSSPEMECAGLVSDLKPTLCTSTPLSPPSEIETATETAVEGNVILAQQHGSSLTKDSPIIPINSKEARICRTILTSTQRQESAWPFKQPVDPVALGAYNYFEIVKQPMDLSTISKRLAHSVYPTVQAFACDFRLMLDNCYLYNPPAHVVHIAGRKLDTHIASQIAKYFPDIKPEGNEPSQQINHETSRSRRNIRPPKVYEPDELPTRKRSEDFSEDSARKRRLSGTFSKISSGTNVTPELQSIMNAVQNVVEQIASIQSAPPTSPTKSKSKKRGPKSCTQCHIKESSVWKSGPAGRATLCKKCGDKYQSMKKSKKPLSYSEQVFLSERFGLLDGEKQRMCMEIISGGRSIEGTEFEIDIGALDVKTARRLFEFVEMQAQGDRYAESSDSDSESDSSGSESE